MRRSSWSRSSAKATPTIVIVKHANPCGVATRGDLLEAWNEALACDSVSAFGGIVATNRPLDAATAEAITEHLHRSRRRPRCRRGREGDFRAKEESAAAADRRAARSRAWRHQLALIAGGLLVQDRDNGRVTRDQLKCVTRRQPTEQEMSDCLFAWTVAKHVKSNAIVYARDGVTAGIGAGQMNRRDSARIAAAAREGGGGGQWLA